MLINQYLRKALTQRELNDALFAHERYLTYQRGGVRAELASTRLDGLNLANRNLADSDFSFASLVGGTIYGSNLGRAKLVCSDLRDCDLRSARIQNADMRGASMCGAKLGFAKLDGTDLRAATVKYKGPGSNSDALIRVDFSNSSLKGVSFGHAKLDGVDFTGAILQGADFRNAQLSNACFRNAVLIGVNLADLNVPPEALEGCVLGVTQEAAAKAAILAAKLEEHQLCAVTDGKRGRQAILDGEDLRPISSHFAGKILTGLSARGANAFGIDFTGCQLQGARFECADLRECKFNNADVRGASFKGAKLSHAEFDYTNLGSLLFDGGKRQLTDFTDAAASKLQFFRSVLETDIGSLGLIERS